MDISTKNYKDRYQQYMDFEKIIEDEYCIIGKELVNQIIQYLPMRDKHKCLDVGCGTGKMPMRILSYLGTYGSNFKFDYMDPVEEALNMYENNVPMQYRGLRILNDWSGFTKHNKYSLVLANNSLCGINSKKPENILKFFSILKSGGVSLITLPSQKSDWVKFAKSLWPMVHGKPFQKTTIEDITIKFDIFGINHCDQLINIPILIEDSEKKLETIFSIMMYVNRDEICSKYNKAYKKFRNKIFNRTPCHIKLIYGISTVIA